MSNIVLIGYRGVGKSSLAKILAQKLWWDVISTDELIEKKVGPLTKYIEENGWEAFRQVETEVLSSIEGSGHIIDCGGGIIEREENHDLLRNLGKVYWLKAPVSRIKNWLSEDADRPALQGHVIDEVEEVLRKRTPLYASLADNAFWTDKDLGVVAQDIIAAHHARVAVSLLPRSVEEAQQLLIETEKEALVELRLDGITDLSVDSLRELLELRKERLIVTNRVKTEGGVLEQPEEQRIELLTVAIECDVDYVDVELSSGVDVISQLKEKRKQTQIICSFHDFEGTSDNLTSIYEDLKKGGADIVKMACMATSLDDVHRMYDVHRLASDEKIKFIGLSMGDVGKISRLTSGLVGGWITSYVPHGDDTAPGQFTLEQTQDIFTRWASKLKGCKEKYGVVGDPIGHSLSPVIQETALFDSSIEADYVRFHVKPEELDLFILGLRLFGVKGCNVTVPHKQTVMEYLDEVDLVAQKIGAVNTIVSREGRLVGYNTDWLGVVRSLEEQGSLDSKKVTLVGAGGASRAVVYGLVEKGCQVTIVNRTDEKAQTLADEFSCLWTPFSELESLQGDILINSTPLGMIPRSDELSVPERVVEHHTLVFDCIYNPLETTLLQVAHNKGKVCVNGLRMLIHQGAEAFTLWLDTKPDSDRMYTSAVERL